jgi:hypothetical protein
MLIRKSITLAVAAICATMSLQALAGDLIINNRTDLDSTSVINGGACSTKLGEIGIARAHTENNVVPDSKVRLACFFNKRNCKAEVHLTANCTGPIIATVYFDVDAGIKPIKPEDIYDNSYNIVGAGFSISLEKK